MNPSDPPRAAIWLVTALAGLLFLYPLSSFDVWWHLDSGRWMVEHGRLLLEEIRSFTFARHEWVNHSWLFQLLLGWIHRWGGEWGLLALKGVLIATLFLLLAANGIGRRQAVLPFVLVALLLMNYLVSGLNLRPHLLEALYLLLLVLLARLPFRRHHLLYYAALLLVWANTHASAIVGATAISLHLLIDPRVRVELPKIWMRLPPALLLPAVILITPFGPDILQLLFGHRDSTMVHTYITEWWPPNPYPQLHQLALVIIGAALGGRRLRLATAETFLLLFFLYMSLDKARFVFEFSLLLVRPLSELATLAYLHMEENRRYLGKAGFLAAILIFTSIMPARFTWSLFQAQDYPVARGKLPAATALLLDRAGERLGRPIRVFNNYGFGGYLGWIGQGKISIFIDGRSPTIYSDHHVLKVMVARRSRPAMERLVERHAIDAYLDELDDEPTRIPLDDPRWQLVAYDDASVLYLRTPIAERLGIPRLSYDPGSFRFEVSDEEATQAIAETRAMLERIPDSRRARLHLGLLLEGRDDATAIAQFRRVLELRPHDLFATVELGNLLLDAGTPDAEVRELVAGLPRELPPGKPKPFELPLAKLLLRLGLAGSALQYLYPDELARRHQLDRDTLTWLLRGNAHALLGETERARFSLEMAELMVAPDQPQQLTDLAALRQRLAQPSP